MAYRVWVMAAASVLAGLSMTARAQDDSGGAAAPSDSGAASSSDSGSSSSDSSSSSSSGDSGGGGFLSTLFTGLDYSVHGFIRSEDAFSTGFEDPSNQRGNPYNGQVEHRIPGVPNLVPGGANPATDFSIQNPALVTTTARPQRPSNNMFNDHTFRGEADINVSFSNDLKFETRLRTIAEIGHYSEFRGHDACTANEGCITGGDQALYGGAPNYFQYHVEHDKHPNPLEFSGANYLAYFPVMILNYAHGPLNLRLGNQQIAWGQAIFFRVLDVPDGLDLRRHLILGKATEEYSDSRVPALALRVGYQFNDQILADAYVQKFQPTIYPNPNTPYNVIPAQFTVHDMYKENGYENKVSYGLRLKADFGQFGLQAIAVRRYNPDGVFRWTKSGVNKNLPGVDQNGLVNPLGVIENTANNGATPNPYVLATLPPMTTGALLAQTPFEASPGGVVSGNEFCGYAAYVRLKCVDGLNASINDFAPYTSALLATPVNTYAQAHNELDTFFTAAGNSLRGHIKRDYFEENVFGLGGSIVTEAEPGTLLDQIVINLETTYVPNRHFTPVDLGHHVLKQSEITTALVAEKYQRFSNAFPATYMVFQALYKTKSDLFGRSLRGYGGSETKQANGQGGGSTHVVLAAIQPFPQEVYEAYFAALFDVRGGMLVQPGLRWKPNTAFTVEGFYTYINGHLGDPTKNDISTLDFADEASVRLTFQF